MPAGISWPRYLAAVTCAMVSMFAGSQAVHVIYKPLQDLSDRVEMEKQKLKTVDGQLVASSMSTDSDQQGLAATD